MRLNTSDSYVGGGLFYSAVLSVRLSVPWPRLTELRVRYLENYVIGVDTRRMCFILRQLINLLDHWIPAGHRLVASTRDVEQSDRRTAPLRNIIIIIIIIIIIRQFIRRRNMSVKSLQGRSTENTLLVLSYTMYDCRNRWVLRRFLKVDNVDAVRMSDGRLFQAARPATQNVRLPRRRLVLGSTRSPRAAERRAARVEMVVTGTHKSCI